MTPLRLESRLGPYSIRRRLGGGGMGEVYGATDTRLGREVAIKVLPERLSRDPEALRRFARETRAVAALNHPSIVVLYDVGSEGDLHYVVTELLLGTSLDELLERGPLTWRQALDYGIDIAKGLTAIHAAGIIHRDLKPGNLFVTQSGQVKILDFGIARYAADPLDSGTFGDTTPGMVLGTVGYMSPEQAKGEAVGPGSDLFVFGSLLFEMLTAQRAFAKANPVLTLGAIVDEAPPEIRELAPGTPDDLIEVMTRCLAKPVEERFETAGDLVAALRSVTGNPRTLPEERPSGAHRRLRDWLSRALRRRRGHRSLAVLPLVDDRADPERAYLAAGISENLIRLLTTVPRLDVLAWSTVRRYGGAAQDDDPQAMGRQLGVDRLLLGRLTEEDETLTVFVELVDVRTGHCLWANRHRYASHQIVRLEEELAEAIARQLEVSLDPKQRQRLRPERTIDPAAYRLYLQGRHLWNRRSSMSLALARERLTQALEIEPGFALAHAGLADIDSVRPFWGLEPPKTAFPRARESALRALELVPDLAEAHSSLAYVQFYYDWDWAASRSSYLAGMEANPSDAMTHHRFAVCLGLCGLFDEAYSAFDRALQLEPLASMILADRALVLCFQGRYDEGEEQCAEVATTDPDFAPGLYYRGLIAVADGRLNDAVRWYRRATRIAGDSSTVRASMAHALAGLGRDAAARQLLQELLQEARTAYVSPYLIATVYAGLNDIDETESWLSRAERDRCETLVWLPSDPRLAGALSDPRIRALADRVDPRRGSRSKPPVGTDAPPS